MLKITSIHDADRPRIPLYEYIAEVAQAIRNCDESGNTAWRSIWNDVLDSIEYELPRGSGFDSYPTIERDTDKPNRIVISGSYHKMDENGFYDGWHDYCLTIRPNLLHRFTMTGAGRGEVGEYIYECFDSALRVMVNRNDFRSDLKAA
jgi:hypothetical protein